jgi:ADP-heptose:LPS heptosyltransferase
MCVINACINGIGDVLISCWYPAVQYFCLPIFVNYQVLELFNCNILPFTQDDILKYQRDKVLYPPIGSVTITDLLTDEYKSRLPRMVARAQLLGIKEIKKPVAKLTQEDWAEETLQKVNPDNKPLIILAPMASKKCREWLPNYWLTLADELDKMGLFTLAVYYKDCPYGELFPHRITGTTISHVASLLKRSSLVIGLDSGLAHLAGNLDVKTLALTGPTDLLCFVHHENTQTLTYAMECSGCYFQPNLFKPACSVGCGVMSRITPQIVINKVKGML